jgi:hypothetical protein
MSIDVKIQAQSTGPVQTIGLLPLNNVLVNVFLSPDAYERNKANDRELVPVQCGSMRQAAYLFEPEVSISPSRKEVPVLVGSRPQSGGGRVGGKLEPRQLAPEDILPEASEEQVVPYWRNCRTDDDLPRHFEPSAIVDIMRPKSPSIDRLGLLLRLRLASLTYTAIVEKLDRNVRLNREAIPALEQEAIRLREILRGVRERILLTMTEQAKRSPVRVTDHKSNATIALSVDADTPQIAKHINSQSSEAVTRLIDVKAEYQRISGLLRRGE